MASQDRDRLEVIVLEAQGLLAVEGMISGTINQKFASEIGGVKTLRSTTLRVFLSSTTTTVQVHIYCASNNVRQTCRYTYGVR